MAQLKDLCKKESSNIAQKDLENICGEFPIYGASGLIKYVDFYKQEKPYIAVVKDGAGVGRVMKLPAFSSVIGTLQYIIPNDDINVDYLAYAMKHMNLSKYYMGAAIPHIYFKDYCNEEIPLHTAKEQQKIADTLDNICELIKNRKDQLSKLDELVKARFVEMFGDPNNNEMGWITVTINDIGNCVAGATPSTKVKEYWENGTIPWMSSGEVNKGRVFETDTKITQLGYDNASTKLVPPKTVVLAMAGQGKTRGTAAITEIELCTNQSICSIVTNEKINAEYLLNFLKMQYKELRRASTNTDGRGGLNLKIIGNYPIMLPPMELQNEFAAFVKQIDKSKFDVQQSLEKLETLKKSLMQQYFG